MKWQKLHLLFLISLKVILPLNNIFTKLETLAGRKNVVMNKERHFQTTSVTRQRKYILRIWIIAS